MPGETLNLICTGTFTFPDGMAGTQLVKRFINYCVVKNCTVKVATILQRLNKKDQNKYKGFYKEKVLYLNLGIVSGIKILDFLQYPFILLYSLLLLIYWKDKGKKNIFYVYDNVNLFNALPVLFSRLIGYKVVVEIVEDFSLSHEPASAVRRLNIKTAIYLEKYINLFADSVIVVSRYLENKFLKLGKGQIPVKLIPVSTEMNGCYKGKKDEEKFSFLYAGTFAKKDGLETLVQAFTIFNGRYPGTDLNLVGKTNHEDYLRELLINDKIKYLGAFPDKEYYEMLFNSDVLCVTRTNSGFANAGFPFKIAEYLSTGVPVICTDVSDIKYYLENKKDAVIIQPDSVSELVDAMEFLYLNKNEANKIGHNGRAKAEMFFNSKKNGQIFLDFISL
jgi:glycosyltransferase involved in cell wall biosynthesis